MLINLLKIALRSLYRDRSFSVINLLGLSLGIVAFVFIIRYASFEMSYDRFHRHGENIYRVSRHEYGDRSEASAKAFYAIGPEAFARFPEVTNYTRMHPADGMVTYHDDEGGTKSFFEDQAYYADTSFFHVFSFPWVKGNPGTLVQSPTSVAISETAARKYFGDANPIGKVLNVATEWQAGDYVVAGVFRDVAANSHLAFDFIFPIQNLLNNFQFEGQGWGWTNFYNYLLVMPGTDVSRLQEKLSALPEQYLGALLSRHQIRMEFHLQAVPDIHLHSTLAGEMKETGRGEKLRVLIVAAFFIIGVAWLNYINLTTARALRRSREIGLRKVMGSNRWRLIQQFLLESLLINVIAIGLAALILLFATPFFNQLVSEPRSFHGSEQYRYWLLFMALFTGGTLLSGFYPAVYLSSLRPIQALRGKLSYRGNHYLRPALVVVQFAVSLLLMVGTVVIYQQVRLMQQQELGIDISQKLIIKAPQNAQKGYWRALDAFKGEVTKRASIQDATASFEVPGHDLRWGAEVRIAGGKQDVVVQRTSVDQDFVPTYRIAVVAGRNFSGTFEGPVVLINETASEALGFARPEDAIDQELDDGWYVRRIIGVVSDYHQRSPQFKIEPLVISPFSKEQGYISMTVHQRNMQETLAYIEDTYQTMFPANAFEYFFLDEYFARQYKSDQQFSQVITIFSGLALFIAALGLLGFTTYLSNSRAQEVGVRKVVGAGAWDILVLFNQDIVKLVLVAGLLALPMGYFVARAWLANYAIRIDLHLLYFLLPGAILLVVTLIVTTLQILNLVRTNAVNLIRYE